MTGCKSSSIQMIHAEIRHTVFYQKFRSPEWECGVCVIYFIETNLVIKHELHDSAEERRYFIV